MELFKGFFFQSSREKNLTLTAQVSHKRKKSLLAKYNSGRSLFFPGQEAGQEGHEEGDEEGPRQGDDGRGDARGVRDQVQLSREGREQVPPQVRQEVWEERVQNFWREKVGQGRQEHAVKRWKWLSESESRN